MKINVEGIGKKGYKPNMLDFRLDFNVVEPTQSKAVERGTEEVKKYVEYLLGLKIKKEEIKQSPSLFSKTESITKNCARMRIKDFGLGSL